MGDATYALVTGASQGIGKVFAQSLAARKQNLILVARSKDKLETLADELRRSQAILVEVVDLDLTAPSAVARLTQQIRERGLSINLLVNNAGFGLRGKFLDLPLQRQTEMMCLNNTAVVELSYSVLPLLLEHSQSGIINVSSTAGFQAIPYATLYAATKSFLTAFSLGLQEELRSRGVSVVTLCPGRVRAKATSTQSANGKPKFGFIYQNPEQVVTEALAALEKGGGLVIPGTFNKVSLFAQHFIPRQKVPRLVGKLSRQ